MIPIMFAFQKVPGKLVIMNVYILHKAVSAFIFVKKLGNDMVVGRLLSYFYIELRVTLTPNANFYLMCNWDGVRGRIPAVSDRCQLFQLCTYTDF